MRQFLSGIRYTGTTVHLLSHPFLEDLFVFSKAISGQTGPSNHSVWSAKFDPLTCTMGFLPNSK